MSSEQLKYWLILATTPGLGYARITKIINDYPDLVDFFASLPGTSQRFKLSAKILHSLRHPNEDAITEMLTWSAQAQHHIIPLTDPKYPLLLQQIHQAPLVLFVQGDVDLLNQPQVAMVGSRGPTPQGLRIAHQFAAELAELGFIVTSGMAMGIDGASHHGALIAKGKTIAVFGCGLNTIYPSMHIPLAKKIKQAGGALVSEFPLREPPKAKHFPRRNRIISGLSLGTIVVEAAERSGSLITANYAVEQGREVFAVPGAIRNPFAQGCHQLIQQGAKLISSVADIVAELPYWAQPGMKPKKIFRSKPASNKPLSENHRHLLRYIDDAPTPMDTLIQQTALSVEVIASLVLTLELQGYIRSVPGGYIKE